MKGDAVSIGYGARSHKNKRIVDGYMLVEVGRNYCCACKGGKRVPVGPIRHGDHADLVKRFRKKVDELEDKQWA